MSPDALLSAIRRVRWRSSVATVLANIRLYGWAPTLRKIAFRAKLFLDRRYRRVSLGRGRQSQDNITAAADVFGSPVVLIVGALDLPQCKKYRVSQKVDYFRSIGWECYFSHYSDAYRALSYMQIATALIFYRVPACAEFDDYLEEARRLGLKTFYDIDDPIFNASVYGENKNLEHIEPDERAHLLGSANDYRSAMLKVDARILSTTYLKELAAADLGGPTYLWRNLVDPATLSIVQQLGPQRADNDRGKVIIGYASGSRAHDEDFRVVVPALAVILESYEHVELHVIGYASIPPELNRFKDRINARPFSGYVKYLEALSKIDISIVPLVDDRFNACKSAIRYLEASLCGVPTIASAVGQFVEVIEDAKSGTLAATHESWVAALRTYIESRELRVVTGEAARNNAMQNHTFPSPGVIDQELLKQFALSDE